MTENDNSKLIKSSFLSAPARSIKLESYFETYDSLLAPYRNKPITLVEVGVLGGGSLFMWRDYFGADARIIGIDLNPNASKWIEYGFEIFIGSQSDRDFWSKVLQEIGGIDIFIDDGGHTYVQQLTTISCVLPRIKEGGLCIVEDTHTSYYAGFGPRKFNFLNFSKDGIDSLYNKNRLISRGSPNKHVQSIEFFDSIVVFKISRKSGDRLSAQVENGGHDDQAKDLRYSDSDRMSRIRRIVKQLSLRKARGDRWFYHLIPWWLLGMFYSTATTGEARKAYKVARESL